MSFQMSYEISFTKPSSYRVEEAVEWGSVGEVGRVAEFLCVNLKGIQLSTNSSVLPNKCVGSELVGEIDMILTEGLS